MRKLRMGLGRGAHYVLEKRLPDDLLLTNRDLILSKVIKEQSNSRCL